MTWDEFEKTFASASHPPSAVGLPLQALWWDAKGEWEQAHAVAQADSTADGSWVHAYLHRREGDESNAGYWYARAGKPIAAGSLDDERREIAAALLARD